MHKIYVCKECGSANIEVKAWVNPNTREITEVDPCMNIDNECYCNNCECNRSYKEEIIVDDDDVYVIGDSCLKGNCD